MMVINFARSRALSRVSIGFPCTVSEIQSTGHSRHISPWEVVRALFRKKTKRSYICAKSCAEVEFRSVFHAPSRKFKIQAIPDVLARGKPYEYGVAIKRDGHKLCAVSRAETSFNRFFVHRLRNSKYWPIPSY
ncbi:hypothetical protein BHM03_00049707 [Ensete ventricosum]|nr:hypothetical protein BHM03_00049707 [Ensete ventricosum]